MWGTLRGDGGHGDGMLLIEILSEVGDGKTCGDCQQSWESEETCVHQSEEHKVPFGYAQGKLSTSLGMTGK